MDRIGNGGSGGSPRGVPASERVAKMTVGWRQHAVASFCAVFLIAPIVWMLMDRNPPYVRNSGMIMPDHPAPGDFVGVRWNITVSRVCPPNVPFNVTRTIVDGSGKIHEFTPVTGVYGTEEQPNSPTLSRAFQLPTSITPGPAVYRSTACFACNPIHYLWPVCVKTPEIAFTIIPPMK